MADYDLSTKPLLSSVDDGTLCFGAQSSAATVPSPFSLGSIRAYLSQFFLPSYYYGVRVGATDVASGIDAMIAAGYTTITLAPGTYNLPNGYAKSGVNGISIASLSAPGSSTLLIGGDYTGIHVTNGSFWRIDGVSITRAGGSTAGDAILFDGTSSSNKVTNCYIAGHKGRGVAFIGTIGAQQSGNDVKDNILIDNDGGHIHYVYSNDYKVSDNETGRVSSVTYPPYGVKLDHSSQGEIINSMAWDNVNDIYIDTCTGVRLVAGRVEEARREGIYITGSTNILIGLLDVHTHSKESTGTYAYIKSVSSTGVNIVGVDFYTWDATQGSYCVNLDTATANTSRMVGCMLKGYATAPYTIGSATDFIAVGNDPVDAWRTAGTKTRTSTAVDTLQTPGTVTDVLADSNNPSTTAWASTQNNYRVAGAVRVVDFQQRAGNGSGGQYLRKIADSSGTLQTRHQITQDGHHSFCATATFTGSTGALLEGLNATITRNSTGNYTLTAAAGTLPANGHVYAGCINAAVLVHTVTSRSTTAVTVEFRNLSNTVTDPTTVWINVQ